MVRVAGRFLRLCEAITPTKLSCSTNPQPVLPVDGPFLSSGRPGPSGVPEAKVKKPKKKQGRAPFLSLMGRENATAATCEALCFHWSAGAQRSYGYCTYLAKACRMLSRASIGSFPNLMLPESGHVDLDWIAVSVLMQAELLGLFRRMHAPRRSG